MNENRNTVEKENTNGFSRAEEKKFDSWKHGLFDIGRRNRMLNFVKTSRSTLRIVTPSMPELYSRIAVNEESLSFRHPVDISDNVRLSGLFAMMDLLSEPIELTAGDILSDSDVRDMEITVREMRAKAKLAGEEQGINILYLCFGFLEWRQKKTDPSMLSPLVMVPVSIERSSITSPYMLKRTEEDTVVNPALEYVLQSEFGIELPSLAAADDNIEQYLNEVRETVSTLDWKVIDETCLGFLSFVKIVMYRDLEKNKERIFQNPVIQALCGNRTGLPEIRDEWRNYDHDSVPCQESFLVVNADASQQDAIVLSKNGVSFVLQGPPGTGKSQTITNIIAEALADGKKVLFVSEKMAALSVVYRRLQEAGLSDYCLSLHNFRADKKSVIRDLVNTLDAPVKELRPGISDFLYDMEEEREELNRYFEEINIKRQPLRMSIYEAVCRISEIGSTPEFSVKESTENVTDKEFRGRINALKKYEALIRGGGGCFADHPWHGCIITEVTPEVKKDVRKTLDELEPVVFGANTAMSFIASESGEENSYTWNDFCELREELRKGLLTEGITERAAKLYRVDTENGADPYEVFYGNLSVSEQLLSDLQEQTETCSYYGFAPGRLETAEQRTEILDRLDSRISDALYATAMLKEITECADSASETFRESFRHTPGDIEKLSELMSILYESGKLPESWAGQYRYADIKSLTESLIKTQEQLENLDRMIDREWYRDAFLSIDEERMLQAVRRTSMPVVDWLFSNRRNDMITLSMAKKDYDGNILTDAECIRALETLHKYKVLLNASVDLRKKAWDVLGEYYTGSTTDWVRIDSIAKSLMRLEEYENRYGANDKCRELLRQDRSGRQDLMIGGRPLGDWMQSGKPVLTGNLDRVKKTLNLTRPAQCADLDQMLGSANEITRDLRKAKREVSGLQALMEKASVLLTADGFGCPPETAATVTGTCEFLKQYAEIAERIGKGAVVIQDLHDRFGVKTGEGALRETADILGDHIDRDRIREYVEMIWQYFEMNSTAFVRTFSSAWEDCAAPEACDLVYRHYSEWFTEDELTKLTLDALSDRIAGCREIRELKRWITYAEVRTLCVERGLPDYVVYIEEKGAAFSDGELPGKITDTYQKGFLEKWVREISAREETEGLLRFQPILHEQTIREYGKNSDRQLLLAQERLAHKLSGEKPSAMDHLTNAMDEIAILRKESEKRRRVMPLRKLFKAIPGLLQRLKPCFMMSPLSVSYFLDSDLYKFDMVIFDEASQILPEDAVGAIYRGEQVIIAGDARQMPPTNFFKSTSMGEDFDKEEEDEEEDLITENCESILDEAEACLPSCTLLWHYRSKDESLIAFSNKEIYNNRLITFPNCRKGRDRGLEYIYVSDGVYENRTNSREAQKCVSLLQEHLARHPERSLGIIAFSVKQQAVIEEAVNEFRLQHPEYEEFFDEEKEEPFFVKNLENVQGDERDTIIFSICYARNSQGKMYMRFGPLGINGGERRLNVAITRAKYNVKLVGSILPTDIKLERTAAEGVRLLRAYISYAMQNDYTMPSGVEDKKTSNIFADAVSAFLRENGYLVRRNVGESDYKIDIAVIHPDYSEEYLAGIECDGSNYTMARTAKDRDVLRKRIMSGAGWQLYHMWSYGWFRNPALEKEKLLAFLKEAKNALDKRDENCPDGQLPEEARQRAEASGPDMEADQMPPEGTDGPAFEYYSISDPMSVPYAPGEGNRGNLARKILYVMEKEAPIHREVFYSRMAPVFGSRKVTVLVRKSVDDCIEQMLDDRICVRDDFLYLTDQEEIRARIPQEGDEAREPEQICKEEICDALMSILRAARSLTEEELITETAKAFGFGRPDERIRQYLEKQCNDLTDEGKIIQSGGKILIREE